MKGSVIAAHKKAGVMPKGGYGKGKKAKKKSR